MKITLCSIYHSTKQGQEVAGVCMMSIGGFLFTYTAKVVGNRHVLLLGNNPVFHENRRQVFTEGEMTVHLQKPGP